MPREFPSTEIPPLSDRSLVVSIGSDGSEGSDVVHLRENRFAVVDGPDWGRNDAIRQVATQAAQLLTSKNLDTYSDGSIDPLFGQHHELAHTTFAAGNTAQSFLHGYARSSCYIVGWQYYGDENKLSPRVLYNGRDAAHAPLTPFVFPAFTPISYALVMTDGGPQLFDPKGAYIPEYADARLLVALNPITAALRNLRRDNRPLAQDPTLKNLLTPQSELTDDATALLFEIWCPEHPQFQLPR